MGKLKTKIGSSFHADIYIAGDEQFIHAECRRFVKRGLCVSVFPCTYNHTDGVEKGCMVRLINYPRFPAKHTDDIEKMAIELAKELIVHCGQLSASVICHPSGNTTYIYDEDKK